MSAEVAAETASAAAIAGEISRLAHRLGLGRIVVDAVAFEAAVTTVADGPGSTSCYSRSGRPGRAG